jgi:hypothetical protein
MAVRVQTRVLGGALGSGKQRSRAVLPFRGRQKVLRYTVGSAWTEGERVALGQRVCSATCSPTRPGVFVAMRLFALWTTPCVLSDALATCSRLLLRFVFRATPARVSLLRKRRRNVMHGILKSRAQAMSPRRSCLLSAHTGKPD